MKRIETSKLVLGGVLGFCGVLACFVMVGWFMGLEGAPAMLRRDYGRFRHIYRVL